VSLKLKFLEMSVGYWLIQVTFRAWNVFGRVECGPEDEWAEGQLDRTESVLGIAFGGVSSDQETSVARGNSC